jgi:hypothetical protein
MRHPTELRKLYGAISFIDVAGMSRFLSGYAPMALIIGR